MTSKKPNSSLVVIILINILKVPFETLKYFFYLYQKNFIMANFSTYVDIDPDEFIQNCSNSEIEEMVDILIEEGYLEGIPVTSNKHHNLLDMEWNNLIGKLINSRLLLSNEEEEVIKSIASRF
jgi:hypothetical protein